MRRERHNLSMLTVFTSSALNPTNAWHLQCTNSSGLAQLWILTLSFRGKNSTHCFFSNPQILSPRFRCVMSLTSPGPNFHWDFYFDISEWHILSARAWTPALMLHLTNTCTKQKVLILTKLKGKIYKTKSLRHYITKVFVPYFLCLWNQMPWRNSDETDIITFYNELSSLVRSIPKHNMLIIGEHSNGQRWNKQICLNNSWNK